MKYDIAKPAFDDILAGLKNVDAVMEPKNFDDAQKAAMALRDKAAFTCYHKGWVNEPYMALAYNLHVGANRMLEKETTVDKKEIKQIISCIETYLKKAVHFYKLPELGFWPADLLQSRAKTQAYTLFETQKLAVLLVDNQEKSPWLKAANDKQKAYLRFIAKDEATAPAALVAYGKSTLKAA